MIQDIPEKLRASVLKCECHKYQINCISNGKVVKEFVFMYRQFFQD